MPKIMWQGAVLVCLVLSGAAYYLSPEYARVGYAPLQPINFRHKVHAGELGMDCRYCHHGVERSWYANVPDPSSCMNCHNQVLSEDPRISSLRSKLELGEPIGWTRIHRLPDYVFFNHAVHVNRGVGCVECHGQVNQMDSMIHARSLSMSMCLSCHRNPERYLRPLDQVYNPDWNAASAKTQGGVGGELAEKLGVKASTFCSSCHR
ncbi:MAG: cytochrome c family protein [Verrucomicrobiae bacterium]|nr:cytochrome c family protein [Verrucomicrobiae bacterium]